MNYLEIKDLNSDQRDHLLSQLLAEKADRLNGTLPTPASDAGKEILNTARGLLLDDVNDGRIDDAICEATLALETNFDDLLWDHVLEASYLHNADIESAVFLEVIGSLDLFGHDLQDQTDHKHGGELLSQVGDSVSTSYETEAFAELRAKITELLPALIQESVSWTINTVDIRDMLSAHIHSFMTESVLPNVARTICDAEVCMEPVQRPG